MYVVAITRWGPALEEELPHLAADLGETAYDLRLRIAGPLPVVLSRVESVEGATGLVTMLRGRGHGAVACDENRVACTAEMLCPDSYRFEADALVVSHPAWGERSLPYAGLVALVLATTTVVEHTIDVQKTKNFSAGRALLTGGLVMRKTTKVTREHKTETHERIVCVIDEHGEPLRLAETELSHDGLGAEMKSTAHDNFDTLILDLRARAPQAFFDDRLVHSTRFQRGLTATSSVSSVDLHVHLLVTAYVTGQL